MSEGGEGGALSVTAAPWQAGWEWGRENRPLEGFVSHDPPRAPLERGPGPHQSESEPAPCPRTEACGVARGPPLLTKGYTQEDGR